MAASRVSKSSLEGHQKSQLAVTGHTATGLTALQAHGPIGLMVTGAHCHKGSRSQGLTVTRAHGQGAHGQGAHGHGTHGPTGSLPHRAHGHRGSRSPGLTVTGAHGHKGSRSQGLTVSGLTVKGLMPQGSRLRGSRSRGSRWSLDLFIVLLCSRLEDIVPCIKHLLPLNQRLKGPTKRFNRKDYLKRHGR